MTSISKNFCIDQLDNLDNKYNNIYYSTIKIKPVDVKANTYIDSNKEFDNKNCKSKIGDIARISKYENIFARGYVLNLSDLKNLKILCRRNFFITDFEGKEHFETFYEKEYQGINQKVLRVEKVIKMKSDKLYVKWKCYDKSFNSWIDKKTKYD